MEVSWALYLLQVDTLPFLCRGEIAKKMKVLKSMEKDLTQKQRELEKREKMLEEREKGFKHRNSGDLSRVRELVEPTCVHILFIHVGCP